MWPPLLLLLEETRLLLASERKVALKAPRHRRLEERSSYPSLTSTVLLKLHVARPVCEKDAQATAEQGAMRMRLPE